MEHETAPSLHIQSPRLNQLNVLREIAADPGIKQAALARRCLLSVAMVNNYMRALCHLGLLEYRRKSSKTMTYHLTPSGVERLEELELELIREMARMFAAAQERIRNYILRGSTGAATRVVLVGTDHLAQLAFHALETAGVSILAVCDENEEKISGEFCGRQVLRPAQIRFVAPDIVVIASSNDTDEIRRIIGYLSDRGAKVIRLNKICTRRPVDTTEDPRAFAPAKEHSGGPLIYPKADAADDPKTH